MGCIISGCLSCIATSICTACCNVCCSSLETPEDKITPSTGRVLSVLLLLLSVGAAFGFQYGIAPALVDDSNDGISTSLAKKQTSIGRYLVEAWSDGCGFYDNRQSLTSCAGQAGVFRTAAAAFVFFFVCAVFSFIWHKFNARYWPIKIFIFLSLLTGTIFLENDPLFNPIVMWVCRIGAIPFMIFQQIILIDVCYNWNEKWVHKSDEASTEGKKCQSVFWLVALVLISLAFWIASVVGIAYLFILFGSGGECKLNAAFIAITLSFGVIGTVIQLTSNTNSSLLTSSAIFAYGTYLCFSSVSKNPNDMCNPRLGSNNAPAIVIGITLTVLSLAWTGWSWTAPNRVGMNTDEEENREDDRDNKVGDAGEGDQNQPSVLAIPAKKESSEVEQKPMDDVNFSNSYQINVIILLIICWYAVTMTNWGHTMNSSSNASAANPTAGSVSMWMIIVSQWLMFLLYVWSLVAPNIFPDRDFS